MANGTAQTGLGQFSSLLADMADAWRLRRPPLPFDLARGLAVLKDGPRTLDRDGEFESVNSLGVPMDEVTRAISVR